MSTAKPAYHANGAPVTATRFYEIACDPARSVAVEACAGAGKTWMLVSRMARALLDGSNPQDILAITFTRKAAGEMRERLQQWLSKWSHDTLDQCAAELMMRGMSESEARRRAPELKGLQNRLLTSGRSAQVRTFHSWFGALLKVAPLAVLEELELPADYELLEDDSEAVDATLPRFLGEVSQNSALRTAFDECIALFGRSSTMMALTNALGKRVEFRLADAAGKIDTSVQTFGERFPALAEYASPALALLGESARRRWLERSQVLGAESGKSAPKAADMVVDAFMLPDEPPYMAKRLALLRKAFFVATDDRLTKNLTKFAAAQEAEKELIELLGAVRQHEAWQHQQRLTLLGRALLDTFARYKRERGLVDMGDVELAASRLLTDPALSGWLQQRLDAQVRHLLVDEFQDTNPLQWQTLYGWLSGYAGAGAGQDAPRLFLVGDPKQSIYRFRRAEPQVFRAAQRFVVDAMRGDLLSCDHTRRCAIGVVDSLNEVMEQAALDSGYEGYRTHTTDSDEPGEVLRFEPVERPAKAGADDDEGEGGGSSSGDVELPSAWRDSLTTPKLLPEDTTPTLEARRVAKWIASEMAAGRVEAKNLMVLSRKRDRLSHVEEALRELRIACDQPEKANLAERPAVQDVLALLDVLVSNQHDLSLARALKSPLFSWSDADLVALAKRHRDSEASSWWATLQSWAQGVRDADADADGDASSSVVTRTAERLRRYKDWALGLPPHDCLSRIFRDADLRAAYAREVPERDVDAVLRQLDDLLAEALAFDGGRFLTAYRFLRAMRRTGTDSSVAARPDAVRLLTIHGAKGLEADTVLMLDTDAAPPKSKSMDVLVDWPGEAAHPRRFVFLASEKRPPVCVEDVLATEQQARRIEELNALYVALTRAARRLVVSSIEPARRGEAVTWYQRLAPLADVVASPAEDAPDLAEGLGLPEGQIRTIWDLPLAPALPVLPVAPGREADVVGQVEADATGQDASGRLEKQALLGRAIHRLMQWLPTPAAGFDWSDAHWQGVRREFSLERGDLPGIEAIVHRMRNGEAAWAWDAGTVSFWSNEMDLWLDGQLLRLDRLVRRADTGCWWVLDYKSAVRPEAAPELRAQILQYGEAVRRACPGEPVRVAFVSAEGRLIELPMPPEGMMVESEMNKGDEP